MELLYVYDEASYYMDVFGATSRMMTEVGGGASRTMKLCGATESILINRFNFVCGNRYETKITA